MGDALTAQDKQPLKRRSNPFRPVATQAKGREPLRQHRLERTGQGFAGMVKDCQACVELGCQDIAVRLNREAGHFIRYGVDWFDGRWAQYAMHFVQSVSAHPYCAIGRLHKSMDDIPAGFDRSVMRELAVAECPEPSSLRSDKQCPVPLNKQGGDIVACHAGRVLSVEKRERGPIESDKSRWRAEPQVAVAGLRDRRDRP